MCDHPDFVVLYIECGQRIFSIILRGLRFLKWYRSIGFNLRPPATCTPNRNHSILRSLEAKHRLLSKKDLSGIFIQEKVVLPTPRISPSAQAPSSVILPRFSRSFVAVSLTALALTCTLLQWRKLLSLSLMKVSSFTPIASLSQPL